MNEELSSRLTGRLKSLAAQEDTHDEIASLPVDEQLRLFGEVFDPQSDEEARTLALTYLEEKHADALRAMGGHGLAGHRPGGCACSAARGSPRWSGST